MDTLCVLFFISRRDAKERRVLVPELVEGIGGASTSSATTYPKSVDFKKSLKALVQQPTALVQNSTSPVFRRRFPCHSLEVFPEDRLRREIQFIADLLY